MIALPEKRVESILLFMMIRALSLILLIATFASPVGAASISRFEIGPWPVVSKLIGYRDRIWFANSVKGINHNSADLWSIPLTTGDPRYEGHLFSQDAGDPVVHRGLLYWPLEDGRAEPGIGAFNVTDGDHWEHGLIPTDQAFHVHAMTVLNDVLYAAPSAWKASIARSRDGGESWESVYLHPTPDRRVSRITDLVALGDRVLGALNAPEGRSLIRVDDGSGEELPGWPANRRYADLITHQGQLYGLVGDQGAWSIWRSDGAHSFKVWTAPEGWTPLALASDGDAFWMAGRNDDVFKLWRSQNGMDWVETADLESGRPLHITPYRGVIAIGGQGSDDQGILWVVRSKPPLTEQKNKIAWPSIENGPIGNDFDWPSAADRIDQLLSNLDGYGRYGSRLGRAIMALPTRDVPASFYNDRLQVDMPDDPFPMFADIVLPEAGAIGRWYLYWGMGLSRTGDVDPADILRRLDLY